MSYDLPLAKNSESPWLRHAQLIVVAGAITAIQPAPVGLDFAEPNYGESYVTEVGPPQELWTSPEKRSQELHPVLKDLRIIEAGQNKDGSNLPNKAAVHWAAEVLQAAGRFGLSPIAVTPCVDGGITIIFERDARMGVLEIFNSEEIAMALSAGPGRTDVWDVMPEDAEIDNAIEQLGTFLG